jgi:hypothetical protein
VAENGIQAHMMKNRFLLTGVVCLVGGGVIILFYNLASRRPEERNDKFANHIAFKSFQVKEEAPTSRLDLRQPAGRLTSLAQVKATDKTLLKQSVSYVKKVNLAKAKTAERLDSNLIDFLNLNLIPSPVRIKPDWKLVFGVAAVSEQGYPIKKGKILARQNGFEFYKSKQTKFNDFDSDRGSLVVFNPDRNQLGVITGIFIVSFNHRDDVEKIAMDYHLQTINVHDHIQTAFLKVYPGVDLEDVFKKLERDSRIRNVELEINSTRMRSE